ncbi:MAG TPA: EAL domain-containing protein [Thermoanaerobaculia bacterium]|nr:EAL domain-containing protein [Thermoanaerobaculia bacterium]
MKTQAEHEQLADLVRRGFHSVVFQPIRRFSDETLFGFEALMRGPEGTVLENPASIFRSDAVDRSLLHEIDSACILSAVRLGRVLDGSLFVNIHGETLLRHATQRDDIMRLLPIVDVDPRRVVLEISETTDKAHVRAIKRSLQPLRNLGMRLALDDIGVFSSWLHHMVSLEAEFMKIDRQFITNIDSSPSKMRLLRGFVAFARETGAELIVEGVEREEEHAAVLDSGVDLAQGFFYGHPEPVQTWIDLSEAVPDQTRVSAVFE